MRRAAAGIAVWAATCAVAAVAGAADATLREDRIRFVVHDLVAGQLTAAQLGGYLETVHDLLHGSQSAVDVPTCTDFGTVTAGGDPPHLFTSNGGLDDSLAVVDTEQELLDILAWAETQGDRVGVFVQDIQWCGGAAPNAIGCAPTPGNVFVVALDAPGSLRPMVIAHERGHDGGLPHRTNDSCALMYPSASATHGCLDNSEATAFWNQADINTGDTCECIDLQSMGPFKTWSLNPDGTSCDDADLCTAVTSCDSGLCAVDTATDCSDGNLCTQDLCDPQTGCSNPVLGDGLPCFDSTVCNGFELCIGGVCQPGTPLVCDDGAFCNGTEICDALTGCQPGTPPDPDDGIACTDDSCDEVGDTIVHAPNDPLCDDGAFCDGAETCNASTGCQPGTPPEVDDGVACTDDSCDEVGDVVVNTPTPGVCDDQDPCTAESCDAVAGCANDPIPACGVDVPSGGSWSRAALIGLLCAVAAWRRIQNATFSRPRM